jgi:hypothetical protein
MTKRSGLIGWSAGACAQVLIRSTWEGRSRKRSSLGTPAKRVRYGIRTTRSPGRSRDARLVLRFSTKISYFVTTVESLLISTGDREYCLPHNSEQDRPVRAADSQSR